MEQPSLTPLDLLLELIRLSQESDWLAPLRDQFMTDSAEAFLYVMQELGHEIKSGTYCAYTLNKKGDNELAATAEAFEVQGPYGKKMVDTTGVVGVVSITKKLNSLCQDAGKEMTMHRWQGSPKAVRTSMLRALDDRPATIGMDMWGCVEAGVAHLSAFSLNHAVAPVLLSQRGHRL